MSGRDGLHVHVVITTDSAYGCWARRFEVDGEAALLVTRRGAVLGVYPDERTLESDYDLTQLRERRGRRRSRLRRR